MYRVKGRATHRVPGVCYAQSSRVCYVQSAAFRGALCTKCMVEKCTKYRVRGWGMCCTHCFKIQLSFTGCPHLTSTSPPLCATLPPFPTSSEVGFCPVLAEKKSWVRGTHEMAWQAGFGQRALCWTHVLIAYKKKSTSFDPWPKKTACYFGLYHFGDNYKNERLSVFKKGYLKSKVQKCFYKQRFKHHLH